MATTLEMHEKFIEILREMLKHEMHMHEKYKQFAIMQEKRIQMQLNIITIQNKNEQQDEIVKYQTLVHAQEEIIKHLIEN